jgi:hypothetical protein
VNRDQLQHVVYELGERFGLPLVYIVGSSAVFATLPHTDHEALTATRDVDVALPADAPIPLNQIDWVMGEGSDFDASYGYYAQGVDLTTPVFAPKDWTQRVLKLRVGKTVAHCMEIHDLALAKYGAGRDKDFDFTLALVKLGALQRSTLEARLPTIETTPAYRDLIAARIARDFASDL